MIAEPWRMCKCPKTAVCVPQLTRKDGCGRFRPCCEPPILPAPGGIGVRPGRLVLDPDTKGRPMDFSLDQFYRLNRRALIWIILVGMIWLLRDFFALIFLTFVLAFVATPLARFLERRMRLGRRLAVVIVYVCFLGVAVSFVVYVTPRIIKEAYGVLQSVAQTEEKLLRYKKTISQEYPSLDPLITGYIRSSLPEEMRKKIEAASPPLTGDAAASDTRADDAAEIAAEKDRQDELLIKSALREMAAQLQQKAGPLVMAIWRGTVTFMLALLFSFLITLDVAGLSRDVQSLRASRLHDFSEQAAQPVVRFAYVVGRAFQAQAVIACFNTFLTLLGLVALGIPSVAMLSSIVFVCSFIPVLGVFISTMPIVLVALNAGGLVAAIEVVGLIIVIHLIEAYLLNPLIYGKHLKINPVLVLMILFVGHEAFGLWGMLLGVPVAHYFIHDVFGVPIWSGGRLALPAASSPAAAPRSDVAAPPPKSD